MGEQNLALKAVLGLTGGCLLLLVVIAFFGADPASYQDALFDLLLQIALLGAGAMIALIGVRPKLSRYSKDDSRHLPRQADEPED